MAQTSIKKSRSLLYPLSGFVGCYTLLVQWLHGISQPIIDPNLVSTSVNPVAFRMHQFEMKHA